MSIIDEVKEELSNLVGPDGHDGCDIEQLAAQLEAYNAAYRSGDALVDDATYDRLVEQLRSWTRATRS